MQNSVQSITLEPRYQANWLKIEYVKSSDFEDCKYEWLQAKIQQKLCISFQSYYSMS